MSGPGTDMHRKVEFEVPNEDGTVEVETIWAVPVENGYRVDNIPFYVRGIAWGDIIQAVAGDGGRLRYEHIVAPSGHATVRLWFSNPANVQEVRNTLREMGCGSELDLERLVAVDIPGHVKYSDVVSLLDEQERIGILEYEEGCLGNTDPKLLDQE